ncbi:MAG TPA: ATP-binding cassette domain-containing protein [Fodinibius sp.]|nr:ATP-binding cassette domain-containing protein [Fodinibius sp.]
MIELQQVSKFYEGQPAICDLTLQIKEGETFGLIGTSGCGKTTTLKLINRLIEPTSGTIYVDGKNVHSVPLAKLRRNIGYVIQNVGLFPHYSVQKNIALVPRLLDWDESKIRSRNHELLELVGLDPDIYSERMPASLSGGQQQRVGLARALAADPPIILMDEPFGALDPITKREVRKEISLIFKEINKTIVLVTHDVFEAFEMCDRLCLLDEGTMQQVGTPKDLLFRPANDFVSSFFDGNRLQLEMQSITIGDIIEVSHKHMQSEKKSGDLPNFSAVEEDEADTSIMIETSFFDAFEESGGDDIRIVDEDDRIVTQLKSDELLEGFHAVRRNLREEHYG